MQLKALCIFPFRFLPGSSILFGPLRNFPIYILPYCLFYSDKVLFFHEVFPRKQLKRKRPAISLTKQNCDLFNILSFEQTDSYLINLKKGRVIGPTVGVITNDERLLKDVSLDWAKTPAHHFAMRRFSFPKCKYFDEEALVLATTGADTFYHWLIDSLPRLYIWFNIFKTSYPEYIIVNDISKRFVKEYLRLLGFPISRVICLKKNPHICFQKLWVPSLPCQGSSGDPPPWVSSFYKNYFPFCKNQINGFKLFIYRTRKNSRFIYIRPEVKKFFLSKGFIFLNLDSVPVKDQISFFRRAKTIIGVHGAGMANLIFSNRCKVIEIFQQDKVNACYYALSQLNNNQYFYLILQTNEDLQINHFLRYDFI